MADENKEKEKRRYERYNTEVKVYFDFAYDLQTKVEFEVVDKKKHSALSKKYTAISRNIGVEGMSIAANKELKKGDLLQMEVYLPNIKNPIPMEGMVRWCQTRDDFSKEKDGEQDSEYAFRAGIQIFSVNGEAVPGSVHYDQEYKVHWSNVLESVFGNYKLLMGGKYRKSGK